MTDENDPSERDTPRALTPEEAREMAELYRKSLARLRRHFRGGDARYADDVIHDVFAEVESDIERFLGMENKVGWLTFLCKRRLINEARRNSRGAPFDETARPPEAGRGDLSAHQRESLWLIQAAFEKVLKKCPPAQREVVLHKIRDGSTFGIIAAEIGIPSSTARTHWKRFLQQFEGEMGFALFCGHPRSFIAEQRISHSGYWILNSFGRGLAAPFLFVQLLLAPVSCRILPSRFSWLFRFGWRCFGHGTGNQSFVAAFAGGDSAEPRAGDRAGDGPA